MLPTGSWCCRTTDNRKRRTRNASGPTSPAPSPSVERKAISAIRLLAVSSSLRSWAIPGDIRAGAYWRAGLGRSGRPTLPGVWKLAASWI